MPLIEFRCTQCSNVFERLVARSEGTIDAECPQCGQHTGKRLVSLFAAVRPGDRGALTTNHAGCCGSGGCTCRH